MNETKVDSLSLVFRALGDPTRRRMLEMLAEGEATLSKLAEPFSMTMPAVLKHLHILAEAGLVEHHKDGRARHCRLEEGPMIDATVWLSRHCKYWQNQFDLLATLVTTPQGELNDLRIKKSTDRKASGAAERSAGKNQRGPQKPGTRKGR